MASKKVTATCPAGTTMTGGGCRMAAYVGGYGAGGGAAHHAFPDGNSYVCDMAWPIVVGADPPAAFAICCK